MKTSERHFATEAAKYLGRCWSLTDHEAPDFIVTERDERFGLELCQVFSGPQTRKGSLPKSREVATQRRIDKLRKRYEHKTGTPLVVKFVGNMCNANMDAVVPERVRLNLAVKEPLFRTVVRLERCEAQLALHVVRSIPGHANWLSVNDRVGWVHRNPVRRIQEAVDNKAGRLPSYRKRTDLIDQRLLVYCDALWNSGKLRLVDPAEIDPKGFSAIYFFTYPDPEAVTILHE